MERASRMGISKNLIKSCLNSLSVLLNENMFSVSVIIVSIIYLAPRILFPETIEFGYDQPRLSNVVMDYINNGSFMKLQYYSLATAWENLSWGPSLVLFNSVFFYISRNPIVVSYLIIFFNLLSVIIILYLGTEYFDQGSGFFAAIIVASQPWWIIFSRMIYQPTPILTIVTLSTLFLFIVLKNNESKFIFFLVLTWGILMQMYLITFSFIIVSALILIYYTKFKINYKYALFATPVLLVLYAPSLLYYMENPNLFMKFFEFKGRYSTYFSEVFYSYIANLSGLNFQWQLGYAFEDFVSLINGYKTISFIIIVLTCVLFVSGIFFIIKSKNKYGFASILIAISPLWAIPLVGVEYVVPRYYLYIIPAFALIVGYGMSCLKKLSRYLVVLLLFIIFFWLKIMFSYFNFIKDYSYPNGLLSLWSDTPFHYLDQSFRWIIEDSSKIFDTVTISSDLSFPYENWFNDAQTYYWTYLLDDKYKNNISHNVGHYLMYFAPVRVNSSRNYKQIGPYIIERLESDPTKFINE